MNLDFLSVADLIAHFEQNGGILWDDDTSDGWRRMWVICPCCGERNLEICIQRNA